MTCLMTSNIPWYYCTTVSIINTVKHIFVLIRVFKKLVRNFIDKKRTHINLASHFATMAVKDGILWSHAIQQLLGVETRRIVLWNPEIKEIHNQYH